MRANYRIYVRGRLGPEMQHALADLRPELRGDYTQLSVDGADQAALHGTLGRLRGLALDVDSMWRTDTELIDRAAPGARPHPIAGSGARDHDG